MTEKITDLSSINQREADQMIQYHHLNEKKNKDVQTEIDVEMNSAFEVKTRCINIKIKDKRDHVIFEKQMVMNEDNVKIKPFLSLIDEFCEKDKSLMKYKDLFKKFLYKKFKIPEYETIIDKDDINLSDSIK